ncbi:predicted protein [Nematostella vectensis]|uniref:RING finger protein 10 n=1 Tax=Nematostella vectensis TaxID=45351 RepID=A7RLV2_NEMVE|nr:predicted protein [Nematostella vectensis]|eukprot:XP_001639551.1 predicted protein [Nematostella vectensis]
MSESSGKEDTMEKQQQQQQSYGGREGGHRNVSARETVPKNKGQWNDRPLRGRYASPHNQGRRPVGGNKDGRNQYGQPLRQGATSDKRPPTRSEKQSRVRNDVAKKNDFFDALDGPTLDRATGNGRKNGNSLNHLLNFKYEPRERVQEQRPRTGSKRRVSFNKELFLQANCQFVVSDAADYTVYTMEPDLLVDWNLIEQVSDKAWHKCPICYDAVIKKDLKSVVAMESHQFAVGQKITMRLMKRAKNSILVLPKSQKEQELSHLKITDTVDTRFSKLLLASPEDIIKQVISVEETALCSQLAEAIVDKSGEECFIEAALDELKARKEELVAKTSLEENISARLKASTLNPENDSGVEEQPESQWNYTLPENSLIQGVGEYEAAFSDDETSSVSQSDSVLGDPQGAAIEMSQQMPDGLDSIQDTPPAKETLSYLTDSPIEDMNVFDNVSSAISPQDSFYYFYQADDGQNIFLHPINARCLIKEYGSLENSPEYLEAKIKELEPMSQTEDSRKRFRYLSYLPLTCEFVMCEVDLGPPVLSKNTLQVFREELQKRNQRRQKKIKMENKREKKVAMKVASMEGRPSPFPEQSINLSCDYEFPAHGRQVPLSPMAAGPGPFTQFAAMAAAISSDEGSVGPELGSPPQDSIWGSPQSFAQALRTGKVQENQKPVKQRSEPASNMRQKAAASDDSDEEYIPPPTYQSTFSDGISFSLEQHLTKAEGNVKAAEHTSGKKQKKPKKKLLFTTGHMKYN